MDRKCNDFEQKCQREFGSEAHWFESLDYAYPAKYLYDPLEVISPLLSCVNFTWASFCTLEYLRIVVPSNKSRWFLNAVFISLAFGHFHRLMTSGVFEHNAVLFYAISKPEKDADIVHPMLAGGRWREAVLKRSLCKWSAQRHIKRTATPHIFIGLRAL